MADNKDLNKANAARKDEFYTQVTDIEKELRFYKSFFKDKVVLCNCDDPYESNFFKYFAMNFNSLGLKKLIATGYVTSPVMGTELNIWTGEETHVIDRTPYVAYINEVGDFNNDGRVDLDDVKILLRRKHNARRRLRGDDTYPAGDFRSAECVKLLQMADVIVTNPPFSLFREYIAQLIKYHKKFLIIGNVNVITYKDVFPLIKDNVMWFGASIHSGDRKFNVPDDYPLNAAGCGIDETGKKFIRVKGVRWFTNIDYQQRHQDLILYKNYNPDEFPKYDNFDAINVNVTVDIPQDYYGVIGVPVTFLDKYNPDQFEIVGNEYSLGIDKGRGYVNGKRMYSRIFIKRKI